MDVNQQNWLCTRAAQAEKSEASIVVRAAHWMDARKAAAARLGVVEWGDLTVVVCSEDHRPDVEMRVVGDDYIHGGTPDRRRSEVRYRIGDTFSAWEEVA